MKKISKTLYLDLEAITYFQINEEKKMGLGILHTLETPFSTSLEEAAEISKLLDKREIDENLYESFSIE